MRMRRDKVDDLGKIRCHRFVLTRPTRWPFVAHSAKAPVTPTALMTVKKMLVTEMGRARKLAGATAE